ncbi:MAG: hypothetical protein F6K17_40360 [Okeania sp. SIO3C4]|nr:hypothetical protein [Okeania sp. SIO3C4]
MTRFIHDQFAKQYLIELLSNRGQVETSKDISGEIRQADVYFIPYTQTPENLFNLGILEKIAANLCIIEPFRNSVTPREIRSCLGKLFDICAGLEREVNRKNQKTTKTDLPLLWIITPTISQAIISGVSAVNDTECNSPGIYTLGKILRTKIIAVHQLKKSGETLWLRILGRGQVQKEAIEELRNLSVENPLRFNVLELVYNLLTMLELNRGLEPEDRELIMELSPLYLERLENATQKGRQEGKQEGRQEGKRLIVENLLRVRFGSLDEELLGIIEQLLALPSEELSRLILELSREELLTKFI